MSELVTQTRTRPDGARVVLFWWLDERGWWHPIIRTYDAPRCSYRSDFFGTTYCADPLRWELDAGGLNVVLRE